MTKDYNTGKNEYNVALNALVSILTKDAKIMANLLLSKHGYTYQQLANHLKVSKTAVINKYPRQEQA